VTHGGCDTLLAALALGVPAAVLPMGADQLDNADRVDDIGVGLLLDPLTADPIDVATAVTTLITTTTATGTTPQAWRPRPSHNNHSRTFENSSLSSSNSSTTATTLCAYLRLVAGATVS
jgi:hypothetical protein